MNRDVIELFLRFYSATYTRHFLEAHYEKNGVDEATSKSYQLSYPFIYYLHHGELYFKQASIAPIALKPILLFYGLVQFIKGCLLTRDPNYPKNSQVLAHGVSTRKRKKASYQFLMDEVKTQKHGLFGHFLDKMFHVKHKENEKYSMKQLLYHVADMHELFAAIDGQPISYIGKRCGETLIFSNKLLDDYHMTPKRFAQYLQSFENNDYDDTKPIVEKEESVIIPVTFPLTSGAPWRLASDGTPHLLKTKEMTDRCTLPDIAIHYLLLYNLSMICRYEIEWWGELIRTFDGTDYPYISHYLKIAERIIPKLIDDFLQTDRGGL